MIEKRTVSFDMFVTEKFYKDNFKFTEALQEWYKELLDSFHSNSLLFYSLKHMIEFTYSFPLLKGK